MAPLLFVQFVGGDREKVTKETGQRSELCGVCSSDKAYGFGFEPHSNIEIRTRTNTDTW